MAINSLQVAFIYTMSFNLFSNPIGRHEKRYFIYKEIKLKETEVTCPNWHRE